MPSGRVLADTAGPVLVAARVALGAGWGGSTFTIGAGSNDTRGSIFITVVTGGGLAQATSTVTITFANPLDVAPQAIVCRGGTGGVGTGVATLAPQVVSSTTTAFVFISNLLPVNAETQGFSYFVC